MSIPSPDAAMVALADRLLAIPQSRGIPLPSLLAPIGFGPAAATLAMCATLPGVGQLWAVPIWLIMGLSFGHGAKTQMRGYRADSGAWNDRKAREYRARALAERERGVSLRASLLVFVACIATACAVRIAAFGAFSPWTANLFAYLLVSISFGAALYARCAYPRDPDLRAHAGVPQAA